MCLIMIEYIITVINCRKRNKTYVVPANFSCVMIGINSLIVGGVDIFNNKVRLLETLLIDHKCLSFKETDHS